MSQERHLFIPKCAENTNTFQYLGSDGLPITRAYNLYLNKCNEFKAKAKKYAKDNSYLKQSILHHTKTGYERSEQLEEEVLLEREEHIKNYRRAFDLTLFDEDPNAMYECFTGKSKRIRIIREFQEVRNEEFSDEFENKTAAWFTRYCVLSRFIQCARKIILINRLQKALTTLRALKPETTKMIQDETITKEKVDKNELCQNEIVVHEKIK